jgi:hypothetical protein
MFGAWRKSGDGGVGEGGDALTLKAEGDENVTESLDGEVVEEFAGEIDGEGTLEIDELANQGGAVQGGDQADELFNLLGLKHHGSAQMKQSMTEPLDHSLKLLSGR